MSRRLSGDVIRQIGVIFRGGTVVGLGDEELLERFVDRDDRAVAEAAFQAIVTRHGPMVLSVCRRSLSDPADAEDAFQATFLVLARKARSVRVRDGSLGPWLRGVARKVARKAHCQAMRRPDGRGSIVPEVVSTASGPIEAAESRERAVLLRNEVARLPEHYRQAVELCHLEGQSIDEAAAALGRPSGTIKVRLARARALLRVRLSRRGLSPDPLPVVPAALIARTVRVVAVDTFRSAGVAGLGAFGSGAVVTLAEGAITMMAWAKVQGAGVALLSLGVTVAAVGGLTAGGGDGELGDAVAVPQGTGQPAGVSPVDGNKIPPRDAAFVADQIEFRKELLAEVQKNLQLLERSKRLGELEIESLEIQIRDLEEELNDLQKAEREAMPPAGQGDGPFDLPPERSPFDEDDVKPEIGARRNPEADREKGRLPEPPEWVSPEAPRKWERSENAAPEYVVEPPDLLRVEVLEALPGRPITGERLVQPDGRVSLEFYGELYVEGLTVPEIKEKVVLHLRRFLSDDSLGLIEFNPRTSEYVMIHPRDTNRVFVDVTGYNSKVIYLHGDVVQPGRIVMNFRETVLDVIIQAGGLLPSADPGNIRLVRPPSERGEGEAEVLPIDWEGIVERGESETNYTLKPGDRILVGRKTEQPDARQIVEAWFLEDEEVRSTREAVLDLDRQYQETRQRTRNTDAPAFKRLEVDRQFRLKRYFDLWSAREPEYRSRLADEFGLDWDPVWMKGGPPAIENESRDAPAETLGDPGTNEMTLPEVERTMRRLEDKLDALMERIEPQPDPAGDEGGGTGF
ncbi:sigma-70 family RNA polymerase sigma factor [Tautonia rosea]|uniref:sigma-70 family RNA polymerase sigma factor n=1 Tax=Tautonia rosea TaxID=2728037 RepID=UPI0014751393|nr:sigma-70 family RNA polymerase sigma factor [Tautonia rosea]